MAKTKDENKIYWRDRLVFAALCFLRDSDGSASLSDVVKHLENNVVDKANIPQSEFENHDSAGRVKWNWGFQIQAVKYVTAGFLRRAKGVWSITPLGLKKLAEGNASIARGARESYSNRPRKEKAAQADVSEKRKQAESDGEDSESEDENAVSVGFSLEAHHDTANKSISGYIESMSPFELQDLVAALFRGMGYYVHPSMVSQKNVADGGIDVIAYQHNDPLGAKTPRIKAQVKHRKDSKAGEPELQNLLGAMTGAGDIGVFISTGGFARGCHKFVKQKDRQMELVNMSRFIELWRDNYDKLSDDDKSLLPLQPVFFLDEERAKRS